MSEHNEKTIYIGNGKKMKDNWFKSSICLSNIPEEHTFEYGGKKYVKVNINVKPEKDQFDNDVNITVDTWKPEPKTETAPTQKAEDDDLPF